MRKFLVAVILLLSLANSAFGQALPSIAVGVLLNDAEAAAENLIQKGFDRLDMTIVRAGYEARTTIFSARQDLESVIDKSADTINEVRQNTVSDVLQLTRALKSDGADIVSDIRAASNEVLSSVTLIVSDGVGSIHIKAPFAEWGDEFFDLRIEGVALSQLLIENFTVDNNDTSYSIVEQDDQRVTIRVPFSSQSLATDISEKKIKFEIRKPRWFEWLRGKIIRKFSTIAVIVPRDIGSVTAVYSAEQTNITRTTRTAVRETRRVQSRVRGIPPRIRRGSWSGSYNFSVAADEKLVNGSVSITPRMNSGCHGSSTRAVLDAENEREFKVNVSIKSDRRAGATCRMNFTVSYSVESSSTIPVERKQNISPLKIGERGVLDAKEISEGVTNLRLAYVDVKSSLFKNGVKRLLPGEKVKGAELQIDQATGYNYVTVKLE